MHLTSNVAIFFRKSYVSQKPLRSPFANLNTQISGKWQSRRMCGIPCWIRPSELTRNASTTARSAAKSARAAQRPYTRMNLYIRIDFRHSLTSRTIMFITFALRALAAFSLFFQKSPTPIVAHCHVCKKYAGFELYLRFNECARRKTQHCQDMAMHKIQRKFRRQT